MTPEQALADFEAARAAPAEPAEYASLIRAVIARRLAFQWLPLPAEEEPADGWSLRRQWMPPTGAVVCCWVRVRMRRPEDGAKPKGQWLTHVLFDPERRFHGLLNVLVALDHLAGDGDEDAPPEGAAAGPWRRAAEPPAPDQAAPRRGPAS